MQFLVDAYGLQGESGKKCTLCGKFSIHNANMRRHMILKHTKPTNNVCSYCKRNFKQKLYLDRHIRSRECLSDMLFDAPSSYTQLKGNP